MSINGTPRSSVRASNASGYAKLPEEEAVVVDMPVALSHEENEEAASRSEFLHSLKVAGLFLTWWVLSIGYNVYNKRALNNLDLAWSVAWVQFFVGVPVNLFFWGTKLRAIPKLSRKELVSLLPVASCHCLTHVAGVVSLGSGAVSFTHIIKSMEPIVTAMFSGLLLNKFYSWQVYGAITPIIFGVSMASVSGSIGWSNFGFATAMMSNIFAALRGVIAKQVMRKDTFLPEQNMSAQNIYAVMTFMSTLMLLPIMLAVEASTWATEWRAMEAEYGEVGGQTVFEGFLSGCFYYFYNEVAFMCLDNVTPVTHAVGNTSKRVLVIGSAIWIFNTPMTTNGYVGSTIAILGSLCYALSTKKYTKTYKFNCACCVESSPDAPKAAPKVAPKAIQA